jgi:hypothetical protein
MGRPSEAVPESVGKYGEYIGPVDYGCVRRFRHRRLVTFLWLNGFSETFRGYVCRVSRLASLPIYHQFMLCSCAEFNIH